MTVATEVALRGSSPWSYLPAYGTVHKDDKAAYFGDEGDAWIKYNSNDDVLEIGGKGARFSTGIARSEVSKATSTTLTNAEVLAGLVKVTASSQTMSLPAAAAGNKWAEVIIAPQGAFSTTVNISGGAGFGNSAVTSVSIPAGASGVFTSNGTYWFFASGGGALPETLALADLSDVSGKTGTGTTVVMSGSPTIAAPWIDQVNGSALASGTLTLSSTSHATKGEIIVEAGSRFKLGTFSADPGTLVDGDVWFDTTLTRFRGRENSTTLSFAAETITDAARFAGADLGAKVQAAHDSLGSGGGVIDARGITSNLTIGGQTFTKPVKILWPSGTISVTSTVSLTRPNAAAQIAAGADSAIFEGTGTRGTIFSASAGITVFDIVCCFDVVFRDLHIIHGTANAANVGIKCRPGADPSNPWILRPRFENVILEGSGTISGTGGTGHGISFQKCYVGEIPGCHIFGWDHGVHFVDNGLGVSSNAVQGSNSTRIYANIIGIYFDNLGSANNLSNMVIEGNRDYGIYIAGNAYVPGVSGGGGINLTCTGIYFEQVTGRIANVGIAGVSDGFSHVYDFFGCTFSGVSGGGTDIILGAGSSQHIRIYGGNLNAGVTIGAGQPAAKIDAANFGANAGQTESRYNTSSAIVWDGGTAASVLQIQNFSRSDFLQPMTVAFTSTSTAAVSVQGINTLVTANPAAISASLFVGSQSVATTASGNAQNFTNAVVGFAAGATHQGTGAVALLAGQTVSLTLTAAGGATDSVGLLVQAPSKLGAGTYTSYTGIRIATPTAATTNIAFAVDGAKVILNDTSTASGVLQVKGQSDATLIWTAPTFDAVGIGIEPTSAVTKLTVYRSSTIATRSISLEVDNLSAPSAQQTGGVDGLYVTCGTAVGNAQIHNLITGLTGDAIHQGTATATLMRGVVGSVEVLNTGNVTTAQCVVSSFTQSAAATTSEGYGLVASAPTVSAGTLTTWYGLFIATPTAATFNYAVYHVGGFALWNAGQTAAADFQILGQSDVNFFYADVSTARLGLGTTTPAERLDVVGAVQFTHGAGTGTAKAIGAFWVDTTAVGNVGAGEDTLITKDIAASSLSAAKKGTRITMMGTFANNANAKTLKAYVGTTVQTVSLAANVAGTWKIVVEVFSTGTDTQDYFATCVTTGAAGVAVNQLNLGTLANDDGAAITVKATGDATSNDDIVQELLLIEAIN